MTSAAKRVDHPDDAIRSELKWIGAALDRIIGALVPPAEPG